MSHKRIRKEYALVIRDECIPLEEIPIDEQETYVNEYLLRGSIIDFPFLEKIHDYSLSKPLYSPEVQYEFKKMEIVRQANQICNSYASTGTSTIHLRELAKENNISFSTLARWRKKIMSDKSLVLLANHILTKEDTEDKYRTCCFYCRDLIIVMKSAPGKISGSKIFRDIKARKPFPCSSCPYHPDVKNGPHKKKDYIPEATCKRNRTYMVTPNREDVVWTIIKRIPEQQKVLEW